MVDSNKRGCKHLLGKLITVTEKGNFTQAGGERRNDDAQNGEPFGGAQRYHEESCSGK